jgi:hypothetical protein
MPDTKTTGLSAKESAESTLKPRDLLAELLDTHSVSPFELDARDFFDRDQDSRSLEQNEQAGAAPQVPPLYPDQPDSLSAALPSNPRLKPDALAEALGPSIENISRFGEPGPGSFADMSESEMRAILRKVLKKL